MTGRPDFSQPGSSGSGQTVAVNARPELVHIDLTQTGSVASGGSESVDVFAPSGSMYTLDHMRVLVRADATATTGSHDVSVTPLNKLRALYGASTYNVDLAFGEGNWNSADSGQRPSGAEAQQRQMHHISGDENNPIRFVYDNESDAAQDNDREYEILAREDSL